MRTRLVVSVGAIALLMAACGEGGSDGGDQVASMGDSTDLAADAQDSTTTTALDPEEAALAYEECMAEHGIEIHVFAASEAEASERRVQVDEFEPGDDPPAPPDPEDFEAAEQECGHLMEDAFGEIELSPEQEAEMRDAQLEMQRCMEERGIEGFEPAGEGGFGMRLDPEAENFDEVQEAVRECSDGAMRIGGGAGPEIRREEEAP